MGHKKRSVLLAERAVQQVAEADSRELQQIVRLQPDTIRGRLIGGRSLAAIRWAARRSACQSSVQFK